MKFENGDFNATLMVFIPNFTTAHVITSTYKEKLVILQSIGIIVIKSKETRVVT